MSLYTEVHARNRVGFYIIGSTVLEYWAQIPNCYNRLNFKTKHGSHEESVIRLDFHISLEFLFISSWSNTPAVFERNVKTMMSTINWEDKMIKIKSSLSELSRSL